MNYKSQIGFENDQSKLEIITSLCQEDNEKIDEFSFYRYMIILDAVVKGSDDDEIYDCLKELIENLRNIEYIEQPPIGYDSQKFLIFIDLINSEELDFIILSCQCISLIISKCNEIGFFYYYSNIIEIIAQKIQNNENKALMYRFFDIICSLSSLDQNVLTSILETFPVLLWIKLLKVDEIHKQFGQYLISITRFEKYDFAFQKSIFAIFSKIIEENQNDMFDPIVRSINQMMGISTFDYNLFFEMNFHTFILSLLNSDDHILIDLSLQIILKSVHSFFYIDQNSIIKILGFAMQILDIQIKCDSLNCLSEILKENQEFSRTYILQDEFLNELACYYETNDFNYQIKICITNFFFNCLLFSDFQLCFSIIINFNIFQSFSFLLNSDDQLILEKLLNVIWRMIEVFEYNHVLKDLELALNEQLPLSLFVSIKDNLDNQFLYEKIIEIIYHEN